MAGEGSLLLTVGLIVFGVPLATFALAELARACDEARPQTAGFLRLVQNLVLPAAAIWVILRWIAGLDAEDLVVRLADTALAMVLVYAALSGLQLLLFSLGAVAQRVPKLLVDLIRLMLVALGAAVIVSRIWGADLSQLVAALGVGSIVLGLALQNVIGGLVGGVFLASFRPFAIGDVIRFNGMMAKVEQLDWRVVTLRADGETIQTPTSELNGKTIGIVGPPGNPRVYEVMIDISIEHSPETVRAALREAAHGIPQLTAPDAASVVVTAIEAGMVRYRVGLPLAVPLTAFGARNELLSRFWYVAQRHGISLAAAGTLPPPHDGAEAIAERVALLRSSGAFARPGLPLEALATAARLERYRPGEAVIALGQRARALLVVVEGEAAVDADHHGVHVAVERLAAGDLYANRAMFRQDPSPVRVMAAQELAVLTIPVEAMQAELTRHPTMARDIEAVLEARGQALEKVTRAEQRGLRVA